MNQEHKLLHGSLCSFSLTKLQGYEANRSEWTSLRSCTILYAFRESNNVKLSRIFQCQESFEIQKRKRSLENFTQLKTGIISVFENAIRLPADALIVLVDTIRRPKNFLIVFFDEKDKNKSVFKQKNGFSAQNEAQDKEIFWKKWEKNVGNKGRKEQETLFSELKEEKRL